MPVFALMVEVCATLDLSLRFRTRPINFFRPWRRSRPRRLSTETQRTFTALHQAHEIRGREVRILGATVPTRPRLPQ